MMAKKNNSQTLMFLIVLCLTLGLAPFNPPHVVEKLRMLMDGTLKRPIDWFDLFLHGTPWVLLVLKSAQALIEKKNPSK